MACQSHAVYVFPEIALTGASKSGKTAVRVRNIILTVNFSEDLSEVACRLGQRCTVFDRSQLLRMKTGDGLICIRSQSCQDARSYGLDIGS